MTKAKKKKNDDSATRTRRTLQQAQAARDNNVDAAAIIEKLETAEARDAGVTFAQWMALTESERTKLWEDSQDRRHAGAQSLDAYRAQQRRRIEAGGMREPYTGFPSWLRDQYAAERPAEVVVEYLQLLRSLDVTSGPALKEILNKIAARTWRGWIIDRSPEEARTLLLQEIARIGLAELFNAVQESQQ